MTTSSIQTLILSHLATFGENVLLILTAVMVFILGMLVFNVGYKQIKRVLYTKVN